MINFSQFLFEMTVVDARSVLGVSPDYDEKDLKTAYRRASSKAHPDKGGTDAEMQKVNQAYELLKKNAGRKMELDAMAERMKAWRDISLMVINDLKKNFNIDAYTNYFESTFGEQFASVVRKEYPDEAELKRLEGLPRPSAPHYVTYDIQWNNHDNSKVFEIGINVSVVNLFNAGGLAAPGTTYQMGVSTFAYINGRKVKITSRDYSHTAKKSVFTTPETVFPKKKIDKKTQSKFKKSDMLAALTREIKAESSQDFFFIPLKGEKFLAIFRTTMMRKGMWSISGIWERKGKYSWTRDKSTDKDFGFYSFMEDEDTLNIFRKVKNMEPRKVEKFLKAEYQKRKN